MRLLNEQHWERMVDTQNGTDEEVDWSHISETVEIPLYYLHLLESRLDWRKLHFKAYMYTHLLEEFPHRIDWSLFCRTQTLDSSVYDRFTDVLDWEGVSCYQHMTESMIRKYADRLHWPHLCSQQIITEDILRDFHQYVDWECSDIYWRPLSSEFLHQFANKIDWKNVSIYQSLGDSDLEEFADRLYWTTIAWNRLLQNRDNSDSYVRDTADIFLKRHITHLNMETLSRLYPFRAPLLEWLLENHPSRPVWSVILEKTPIVPDKIVDRLCVDGHLEVTEATVPHWRRRKAINYLKNRWCERAYRPGDGVMYQKVKTQFHERVSLTIG